MPIYEYECTKCGHQIEEWQSFSDPPIVNCQLCKGKMRKLISQSSFHLKGTGWYVTDYASKRNGNVGNTNKTDKDSESKKERGSTDSADSTEKPKKESASTGNKNAND